MTDRRPPHDPLTSPHGPPSPSTANPRSTDPVGVTIDAIDALVAARVRHDTSAAELRPAIRITVERARSNLEIVLRGLFAGSGGPRRSSSTRMAAVRPGEALLVSGLPAGGASLHSERPGQSRVDARAEPADPDGPDPATTGTPFPLHDDEDE